MLFAYILKVFFPALNSIGGYGNEAVGPTNKQVLQALIIFIPATLIYIVAVYLFFSFNITGFNKIVFPILVFTFYFLFNLLGNALYGQAHGWIIIFTIIPAIIVLFVSVFIGWKSDKKYKNLQKNDL